jgi:hypothetical protein
LLLNYRAYLLPFDVINSLQGLILFCVVFLDTRRLQWLWAAVCLCHGRGATAERKRSRIMTTAGEARERKITLAAPSPQNVQQRDRKPSEEVIELDENPQTLDKQ